MTFEEPQSTSANFLGNVGEGEGCLVAQVTSWIALG